MNFAPEQPRIPKDEFIAMKMLTRFKELRREQPKKPQPDLGWMLDLLQVARHHEATYDAPQHFESTQNEELQMSNVLFRQHRGGYRESMETCVPVTSLADIAKHLDIKPVVGLSCEFVSDDPRNNWETHEISCDGAIIGYTNAMLLN